MVDDSSEFYVNKLKRDINCLSDSDRNARKTSLEKLTVEIFATENKENIKILLNEHLISPLLKCMEDKIEKHRELSIKLVLKIITQVEIDKIIVSMIINSVIGRLDHTPFPETSEELRQGMIQILDKILNTYADEFKPSISQICKMISVLLTDPCPEVKTKLSEFISLFSAKLKSDIGAHAKAIAISLCGNLKHSHNKIRKITVNALIDLLLCDNAGNFFDECITVFKLIANDKNYEVRKSFYQMIYKLLVNWNIIYLRKFEHHLVIFLMNGLSDEKEDIQSMCFNLIEEGGRYRQKLAMELEEELISS